MFVLSAALQHSGQLLCFECQSEHYNNVYPWWGKCWIKREKKKYIDNFITMIKAGAKEE